MQCLTHCKYSVYMVAASVVVLVPVLESSLSYLSPYERNLPYVRISITSILILSQKYLSIIWLKN